MMKFQSINVSAAKLLAAALVCAAVARGATGIAADDDSSVKADDTKRNRTIDHHLTADSQSNSKSAVELGARVRKSIIADKSLSTYGRNIKILVTDENVVTLKGPVHSQDEKNQIERIATNVAGVASVDNQLEVKTK